MTLEEYKNWRVVLKQSNPLPAGAVTVERWEVDKVWEVEGGNLVQLTLPSVPFLGTYFVHKNTTSMWTIDDFGRAKNRSVFKLKEVVS